MKRLINPACLVLVVLALAFTGCMDKSGEEGVGVAVSDDDSAQAEESVTSEDLTQAEEDATDSEDGIVNITDEVCVERPIKSTSCPPEPEPLEPHES